MKVLLIFTMILFYCNLNGQVCNDLFISEYVEGFDNNKAIEIYNPTLNPIDLSEYMIIRYSNGSTAAPSSSAVQLIGTIAPHDVHVGVLEKLNPSGVGVETPVDLELQNLADQFYCPDYNVSNAFYWDGNDAIVLAKGNINNIINAIIIDIFGKIGEDPGAGWSTAFPYTGNGVVVTADHSLIRKSNVLNGVTNPIISYFNPMLEYDSIPPTIVVGGNVIGNWASLGWHTCDCSCITSDTITVSQCFSYTAPSGATLNNSGIYTYSLVNSQGCDSLITIDFTYTPILQNYTINTCQSFSVNNQTYTSSGIYIDTVYGGCDTIVTIDLTIVANTTNTDICAVGVYNANNRVVWEKPLSNSIDQFNIYKESVQAGLYNLIGSTSYSDSALFTDLNSDPSIQSYRYKISTVDTCGNESQLSPAHKTIHLTINQGVGQDWNLIWSHYEGFNFTTYEIYRGSDPNSMSLLTSIQNTLNSYTDQTAPAGNIFYQIVAVNPNGCDPVKAADYASSKSNVSATLTSGIDELGSLLLVNPNPTQGEITVSVKAEFIGVEFAIVDHTGRIVIAGTFKEAEQDINLSDLLNGVYYLKTDRASQSLRIIKQ